MLQRFPRILFFYTVSVLLGSPGIALAQWPASPDHSWLYYEIGGARSVWPTANPQQTSVTLGAGAQMKLGYRCGAFNPVISISNQLNQLRDGADAMSNQMVNAANAAIASLPAYILQRANPGLYDLFQNALLRAEETFSLSTKSCEQMEAEMARGHDPFHEWVVLSKGHSWRRAMGTGGDINLARRNIEQDSGRPGVPWLGGGRQGGANQAPIRTVTDVVRAGYNVTAQRAPAAQGMAFTPTDPAAPPMARHWSSPEAAAAWAVQILGDEHVATCGDADCPALQSTPGMGLIRQVEIERDRVHPALVDLVTGASPLNVSHLEEVSAQGLLLTPDLIRGIRELPPAEQRIAVSRLADEVATSINIERALYLRRFLLAGRMVPEIQGAGPVRPVITEKIAELDQEIENALFEARVRRELVSTTAQRLLEAEAQRRERALGTAPISRPESRPLQGGAVRFP
jgi:integrating conjugative element protein (TIGR03755 family)